MVLPPDLGDVSDEDDINTDETGDALVCDDLPGEFIIEEENVDVFKCEARWEESKPVYQKVKKIQFNHPMKDNVAMSLHGKNEVDVFEELFTPKIQDHIVTEK